MMVSIVTVCHADTSLLFVFFFFFKQKTAYEMRISDWSSDVCSSDLSAPGLTNSASRAFAPSSVPGYFDDEAAPPALLPPPPPQPASTSASAAKIGRASCRDSVCQYV